MFLFYLYLTLLANPLAQPLCHIHLPNGGKLFFFLCVINTFSHRHLTVVAYYATCSICRQSWKGDVDYRSLWETSCCDKTYSIWSRFDSRLSTLTVYLRWIQNICVHNRDTLLPPSFHRFNSDFYSQVSAGSAAEAVARLSVAVSLLWSSRMCVVA